VEVLSADLRFATAHNAVLLTKLAIHWAGYHVAGLELAMGLSVSQLCLSSDTCFRKRKHVDHDCADGVSEAEDEELIERAREFRDGVDEWNRKNYPHLRRLRATRRQVFSRHYAGGPKQSGLCCDSDNSRGSSRAKSFNIHRLPHIRSSVVLLIVGCRSLLNPTLRPNAISAPHGDKPKHPCHISA
jgi:hypothetical protein